MKVVPASEVGTDAINALARAAERATGHEALNEATWVDIAHPTPHSRGFVAVGHERALGYAHVAPADNTGGAAPGQYLIGLVIDPEADAAAVVPPLLDAVANHVEQHHGDLLVLWRFAPSDDEDALLRAAGFTPARELYQMWIPLPLAETAVWPAGVTVRPFEPGRDDEEWLAVNNRAFHDHAEQGGWTEETLRRRMDEPWFDPSLFLLAIDDNGIVAFNWCKLHASAGNDPMLGEIFVIGVDDRGRGRGIGRPLAVAGLDLMCQRGAPAGMLYTAADNTPALRLYKSIGFGVHRVDRAYERRLSR